MFAGFPVALVPLSHATKVKQKELNQGVNLRHHDESELIFLERAQVHTWDDDDDDCTPTKEKIGIPLKIFSTYTWYGAHNRLPFLQHLSVVVTNLPGGRLPILKQIPRVALTKSSSYLGGVVFLTCYGQLCWFKFTGNWSFLAMVNHIVQLTDDQEKIFFLSASSVLSKKLKPHLTLGPHLSALSFLKLIACGRGRTVLQGPFISLAFEIRAFRSPFDCVRS